MSELTLGHIELFAADPAATAAFYLDVLRCHPVVQQPGGRHWLALGSQEFLVRPAAVTAPVPQRYDASALALVLYCDDLDATSARLEASGVTYGAPDGNQRCLTFQDPDGRWIQLVDPNEQ